MKNISMMTIFFKLGLFATQFLNKTSTQAVPPSFLGELEDDIAVVSDKLYRNGLEY